MNTFRGKRQSYTWHPVLPKQFGVHTEQIQSAQGVRGGK